MFYDCTGYNGEAYAANLRVASSSQTPCQLCSNLDLVLRSNWRACQGLHGKMVPPHPYTSSEEGLPESARLATKHKKYL